MRAPRPLARSRATAATRVARSRSPAARTLSPPSPRAWKRPRKLPVSPHPRLWRPLGARPKKLAGNAQGPWLGPWMGPWMGWGGTGLGAHDGPMGKASQANFSRGDRSDGSLAATDRADQARVGPKRRTSKRHHGHLRVQLRKKTATGARSHGGLLLCLTPPWPFHIPSTALHPSPASQLQSARCSPFPPPLYTPAYQAQL